MKFNLVFETSGDCIPFEIKYNQDLFEYFLFQIESNNQNSFGVDQHFAHNINDKIENVYKSIIQTQQVFQDLTNKTLPCRADTISYLDQDYLNRVHCDWALSQVQTVNIDQLRSSSTESVKRVGDLLHAMYPDEVRIISVAEAMYKLGLIVPYEEINVGIHRLEDSFALIEFKADNKWEVFENICIDNMITNNDKVNFSFGYTYVGRQYYNKFRFFDKALQYQDHYNYETLEFAFQISLQQPETIPFSKEALSWAKSKNIKLIAEQIPIGNIIDIDEKLFDYRKILYNNIKQCNKAKLTY
jgi:hypothetical protein